MSWLKSLVYTWFKIFGISSPEDIAAERASRNNAHYQEQQSGQQDVLKPDGGVK